MIIRVKKKSQHQFETQFHITKFTFIVWKILKMRGPRLKQRKNKSPFVFFYIKKTIVSILVLFLSFFFSFFLFFSFLFAFTHQILIFSIHPPMLCWLWLMVDNLFWSTFYVVILISKKILALGWCSNLYKKKIQFYCLIKNKTRSIKIEIKKKWKPFIKNWCQSLFVQILPWFFFKNPSWSL